MNLKSTSKVQVVSMELFLRTLDGIHTQCKKCKKVIKCKTTCLHNHLKLHPTEPNVDECSVTATSVTHSNLQEKIGKNEPKKKKVKLIDAYLKNPKDDLHNVVSKMTACDGLPFNIFCTSDSMRKLFKKK